MLPCDVLLASHSVWKGTQHDDLPVTQWRAMLVLHQPHLAANRALEGCYRTARPSREKEVFCSVQYYHHDGWLSMAAIPWCR